MLAVVADASALALDSLIDAAFAGDLTGVEKEFAKAQVAGTNPSTIIGGAIRHSERLHVLSLEIASGASVSDIVRRPQSGIHFRRQDAFIKALRAWTPERLARVMSMLAQTSLDARKESDLGETIAHRALLLIARGAGRRRGCNADAVGGQSEACPRREATPSSVMSAPALSDASNSR